MDIYKVPSMENEAKNNLLRSWKEIASYLGYDERTCYRWEQKFGMPVHRAEAGASKSHVIAYKDELDLWFQETFKNSNHHVPTKKAGRPVLRWALFGLVPVAVVAAFLMIRPGITPAAQPADFAIKGSALIVLGEDGKELWRHDFKIDGLQDEAFYRVRFQAADVAAGEARLPSLVIKDINSDGRNEVLFAVQKRDDAYGEGDLFCYSSTGREIWHFKAGKEMVFGGRTFSADYRIHGFSLHDFKGDGRQEIAVIADQYPQWPCQLAVLDCGGKKIGEFWNSGYLTDICYQDLDGNGRDEMVVSGVNNQYGGALIIFDPAIINGCSPQSGEFKSETLLSGSEKVYVRTPRTDLSLARGDIVEGIRDIGVTSNKLIYANTFYNLIYYFDFGLRCVNADWGHAFMIKHNELAAAGKIHSALDESYQETIKRGVRYWDGRAWVAEPTPNHKSAGSTK
ncbi:MAG: hypothetical protein ABSG73_05990 [Candidatus Aminicenantales bacterium]|jgi:hypothetical protein